MSELMRRIDENFAKVFKDTPVYDLLLKHLDELFLGIRNNYINIYYRGSSICNGSVIDGEFRVEIAKPYLAGTALTDRKTSSGYTTITPDELAKNENYEGIKTNIDNYAKRHKEKDAQQRLINNNNANQDSEWFCIDMEYTKQHEDEKEKENKDYGRFDIIAITKTTPHRVALIELKYGAGAMGGNSGIRKHANDYYNFFKSREFETNLIRELTEIVRSYGRLFPEDPLFLSAASEKAYCKNPKFYFITLNNVDDCARKTMLRYIRNDKDDPKTSKNNIMIEPGALKGIDITKPNDLNFTPIFYFSEDDGTNISRIIGDKNYQEGFEFINNDAIENLKVGKFTFVPLPKEPQNAYSKATIDDGNVLTDLLRRFAENPAYENFIGLVECLSHSTVIIPCTARISDDDIEQILNSKPDDIIQSRSDIGMKPEILFNPDTQECYLPVFSQEEQIPEAYKTGFANLIMPMIEVCDFLKDFDNVNAVVLNPFTVDFIIKQDIIDIIVKLNTENES